MEKAITGSLGVASMFQLTEKMEALDKESKNLLKYKEVLAVIFKYTLEEYQDYTLQEVIDFIEEDSITGSREVSRNRTNTRIEGRSTEFSELGEKTSYFDLSCRARNPKLSTPEVIVSLHVDLEPQKSYRPGYPIEKRGIYYLGRELSAQLNVLTEQTDYGQLEKCYSIFICRDDIPKEEQMSISFYGFTNFKNVGNCNPKKEDYDLLQMIIIRLGNSEYHSEEMDILEFLFLIFYPHKNGFRKKISKYINIEHALQWKEEDRMRGLGESIYMEGLEEGIEIFILDNLEEGIPEARILEKLQKRFRLNAETAKAYFEKYAFVEQ